MNDSIKRYMKKSLKISELTVHRFRFYSLIFSVFLFLFLSACSSFDAVAVPGEDSIEEQKAYYRVFVELKSDPNLLFSKYDVELELDGEKIGVVSNGDTFSQELSLAEDTHLIKAHKKDSTSPSDTFELKVSGDQVLTGYIKHDRNSVEFYGMEASEGLDR